MVDEKHLGSLLDIAGKHIARMAGGPALVEEVRSATSPEDFGAFLRNIDLGLAPPATEMIRHAALEKDHWRAYHARLVRCAETHLTEAYSPSS